MSRAALAKSQLRLQYPELFLRTAAGIISPDRFEEPQRDADGKLVVQPGAFCRVPVDVLWFRQSPNASLPLFFFQRAPTLREACDFSDVVDLSDTFFCLKQ